MTACVGCMRVPESGGCCAECGTDWIPDQFGTLQPLPLLERGTAVPDPKVLRRYYRELDGMENARRPTGGNESCD